MLASCIMSSALKLILVEESLDKKRGGLFLLCRLNEFFLLSSMKTLLQFSILKLLFSLIRTRGFLPYGHVYPVRNYQTHRLSELLVSSFIHCSVYRT